MNERSFDELKQDVASAMSISDPARLLRLAADIDAFDTPEAVAVAENARGVAHVYLGDYALAIEHLQRSLDAYVTIDGKVGISVVLGNIGNVYKITGDYPRALEYLRRALDMNKDLGNRFGEAVVTGNIGIVYLNTSDYPNALDHLRRALDIQVGLGNRSSVALLTGNIGNVFTSTGDVSQALEHYQRALDMHVSSGDRTNEAVVTGNMGNLHASTGDHRLALTYFERAIELHAAVGAKGAVASVTGSMCKSLIALGEIQTARRCLAELDTMQVDLPIARITRHEIHGLLLLHDGDPDAAATSYHRALDEARAFADRTHEADLHKTLRDLAQQRNDFAAYIEHNNAYQRINDEVHGKQATQKLAMLEAEQRIAAERAEKERHRALLHNTLPPAIAERVLRGEVVNDAHDVAAILFMDIVGFTTLSSTMDPSDVVTMLSRIFTTCDAIMAEHGLMKIKTIGDSYMAAAFGDTPTDVAERAARAALAMLHAVPSAGSPNGSHEVLHVRIGLHCGPVTAGVIGTERLQYDVWGDTVNVASRMESSGEAGRIHVSSSFALAIKGERAKGGKGEKAKGRNGEIVVTPRGEVHIKGKGPMTTFWLERA